MSDEVKIQEELPISEWYDDKDNLSISTQEFDRAVERMILLEEVKDQKKEEYKQADAAYERQRNTILGLLQKTNKTKYFVEGIGTVSRVVKYAVSLPKDPDEKVKVLNYFRSLGDDVYNNTVSIYYATLNAHFNSMREKDPNFSIDGLGEPSRNEEIRFRKG